MLDNKQDPPSKPSDGGRLPQNEAGHIKDPTENDPKRPGSIKGQSPPTSPSVRTRDDWQAALVEQILGRSQCEPGQAGTAWMSQLKQNSAQFLHDQRSHQPGSRDALYKRTVELLIDKMFGLLQQFMYEFNKVALGTDLYVAGTISGDVTEVTRFNKFREAEEKKTFFRARLSTRLYSLVFRGKDQSIDIYLLPVNQTMALSNMENEYRPLTTIEVKITEEGTMWRLSEGSPSIDSLESLCMWLFGELIENTKRASAGHSPVVGSK